MNSLDKIQEYHGPLLQSHGTADEIVPFVLGQRLFEAAPGPKQFLALPGLGHNEPQPSFYDAALAAFLDDVCGEPR
jgi:fermentation-respiration switch protein FrsA (DUF1100 family)